MTEDINYGAEMARRYFNWKGRERGASPTEMIGLSLPVTEGLLSAKLAMAYHDGYEAGGQFLAKKADAILNAWLAYQDASGEDDEKAALMRVAEARDALSAALGAERGSK